MSDRSNIFVIGLPAGVVIIISIFVVISFVTHNPHWLNRGGALVAACAAAAILVQIILEIDIEERRRHELEKRGAKMVPPSSVVEELGMRLYEHRLSSNLTKERLKIAATVVVCAMFGELLHGFGAWALTLLFASHFAH